MEMASPAGFEPTAPELGILCSILLSYGDVTDVCGISDIAFILSIKSCAALPD